MYGKGLGGIGTLVVEPLKNYHPFCYSVETDFFLFSNMAASAPQRSVHSTKPGSPHSTSFFGRINPLSCCAPAPGEDWFGLVCCMYAPDSSDPSTAQIHSYIHTSVITQPSILQIYQGARKFFFSFLADASANWGGVDRGVFRNQIWQFLLFFPLFSFIFHLFPFCSLFFFPFFFSLYILQIFQDRSYISEIIDKLQILYILQMIK